MLLRTREKVGSDPISRSQQRSKKYLSNDEIKLTYSVAGKPI